MIKVNIISNNKVWYKYIKNPNNFLQKKIINFNKKFKKYKKNVIFLTLLLSGDSEIKKLNKKFRKKNKSTDVLSFPFYNIEDLKGNKNKSIYIGDIVLNFKKIDKKNFIMDFNRLWIHGFLHLLGYKHFKDKDFYKMNKLEKKILK